MIIYISIEKKKKKLYSMPYRRNPMDQWMLIDNSCYHSHENYVQWIFYHILHSVVVITISVISEKV